MRLLFGFTLGLTLWQYVVLAAALYSVIEVAHRAFVRYICKCTNYQFLKHEWELRRLLLKNIVQGCKNQKVRTLRF